VSSASALALSAGRYNITLFYSDIFGNPAASSRYSRPPAAASLTSWCSGSFLVDVSTEVPALYQPLSSAVVIGGAGFVINYSLPEAVRHCRRRAPHSFVMHAVGQPLAGTVKLVFSGAQATTVTLTNSVSGSGAVSSRMRGLHFANRAHLSCRSRCEAFRAAPSLLAPRAPTSKTATTPSCSHIKCVPRMCRVEFTHRLLALLFRTSTATQPQAPARPRPYWSTQRLSSRPSSCRFRPEPTASCPCRCVRGMV
jgi:hypothetical protein